MTQNRSFLDELAVQADAKTRARYEVQASTGIVSPIVLAELVGVRPQMIYNYMKKGKFSDNAEAFGTNNTQKKTIDLGEANTWASGYVTRKVAKEAAQEARIEAELAGVGTNA